MLIESDDDVTSRSNIDALCHFVVEPVVPATVVHADEQLVDARRNDDTPVHIRLSIGPNATRSQSIGIENVNSGTQLDADRETYQPDR